MVFGLIWITSAALFSTPPDQYLLVHGGVAELPPELSRVIENDQQGRFKVIEEGGLCVVLDLQSTGIIFNQQIAQGLEEYAAGNEQKGLSLIQGQVAPLVLSWITDPATKSTPYFQNDIGPADPQLRT